MRFPSFLVGITNDPNDLPLAMKAEELLLAGLALNPNGIVSNYFYAKFLAGEKRNAEAITYYKKALNAPPRPNRPIADAGRRKEIQAALKELWTE